MEKKYKKEALKTRNEEARTRAIQLKMTKNTCLDSFISY